MPSVLISGFCLSHANSRPYPPILGPTPDDARIVGQCVRLERGMVMAMSCRHLEGQLERNVRSREVTAIGLLRSTSLVYRRGSTLHRVHDSLNRGRHKECKAEADGGLVVG